MTNFEKLKEQWTFQRREPFGGQICSVIRKMRNIKDVFECYKRDCSNCKEWLTQEYKILDDVERKYLSTLIRPFKNKVTSIYKLDFDSNEHKEYILINLEDDYINMPYFTAGTMYKGMETGKKYTIEELGLKN